MPTETQSIRCQRDIEIAHDAQLADYCMRQNIILENTGHAIIATDVSGQILYFNRAAQMMLGYRWEEIVGRSTPERFHLAEEVAGKAKVLSIELDRPIAPGFEVFVARLINQDIDKDDWTYVRKDGQKIPVSLTITPLRDGSQKTMGYLGLALDITSRREMEQELRIAATAFKSQAAIMVTDSAQRILRVNPAFTQLTGYSPEEAIG